MLGIPVNGGPKLNYHVEGYCPVCLCGQDGLRQCTLPFNWRLAVARSLLVATSLHIKVRTNSVHALRLE